MKGYDALMLETELYEGSPGRAPGWAGPRTCATSRRWPSGPQISGRTSS